MNICFRKTKATTNQAAKSCWKRWVSMIYLFSSLFKGSNELAKSILIVKYNYRYTKSKIKVLDIEKTN